MLDPGLYALVEETMAYKGKANLRFQAINGDRESGAEGN